MVVGTSMVSTPIWAATGISGLLPRIIQTTPGTGNCITIIQKSTGTITIRVMASLSVVLGIRLFNYLSIYSAEGGSDFFLEIKYKEFYAK